ncbi:hypothetical protein GF374_03680 [Candidatus Woesearchaeota archaeon]|nr:hypothetical protein [Candidatus Woesearchaeota archaeon]
MLTIYQIDEGKESLISSDDETGRFVVAEVWGVDMDVPQDAGLAVDPNTLTDEQKNHFRRHGWCIAD